MARKKVVRWNDGDSGFFSDGSRFRLALVRAPEHYQFGGKTATRRAAGMTKVTKGYVKIKTVGRDSYGRRVVEMSNIHGSINNRLIKRGCSNKGR